MSVTKSLRYYLQRGSEELTKNSISEIYGKKIQLPCCNKCEFINLYSNAMIGSDQTIKMFEFFNKKCNCNAIFHYLYKKRLSCNRNCEYPVINKIQLPNTEIDKCLELPNIDIINNTPISKPSDDDIYMHLVNYINIDKIDILTYIYNFYGSVYLNTNTDLHFCVENMTSFHKYTDLIFCNIYNKSISINKLFSLINELTDHVICSRKFNKNVILINKFMLDLVMYRSDFDIEFLINNIGIIRNLLFSFDNIITSGTSAEFVLVLYDRFDNNKLKELGLEITNRTLYFNITNFRLENVMRLIYYVRHTDKNLTLYYYYTLNCDIEDKIIYNPTTKEFIHKYYINDNMIIKSRTTFQFLNKLFKKEITNHINRRSCKILQNARIR